MTGDPRCHPLIELDLRQVHAMLAPLLKEARIHEVLPVEGGLVNSIYRITLDREDTVYTLRVFAAGRAAFEKELQLLSRLAAALPVPEVLFADEGGHCSYPYLVYRWIQGITLNECRRRSAPHVFLTLAEPLGRLLARIASLSAPEDLVEPIPAAAQVSRAQEQLRSGLACERLGRTLADSLRDLLARNAPVFQTIENTAGLVHGDLGGRNILVKTTESGQWEISGVLDWESAMGSGGGSVRPRSFAGAGSERARSSRAAAAGISRRRRALSLRGMGASLSGLHPETQSAKREEGYRPVSL